MVALQHESAIERCQAGDFCRLIWIPPGVSIDDERQQQLLDRLQSDPRNDAATDLLKTPLEDFKSVLHVRLSPPKPKEQVAPPWRRGPARAMRSSESI